jgi:hypothetical protein
MYSGKIAVPPGGGGIVDGNNNGAWNGILFFLEMQRKNK